MIIHSHTVVISPVPSSHGYIKTRRLHSTGVSSVACIGNTIKDTRLPTFPLFLLLSLLSFPHKDVTVRVAPTLAIDPH